MTEKMNRYPGSRPFTREYSAFFFGRNQDIKELRHHVTAHKMTVLYGKSGLGKSSLLNAGLVPILEETEDYLVYFVRFNGYDESRSEKSPLNIFYERVNQTKPIQNVLENIERENISLWQLFKNLQLQSPNKNSVLLVFDQFEELFTYPEEQVNEFGKEFSELISNRMPLNFRRSLYQKYKSNPNIFQAQGFSLQAVEAPIELRIIFSVRSDRMSWLNQISTHIPNILRNCFELKPLNRMLATLAITKPAELENPIFKSPTFQYTPQAIEKILNYLTPNQIQAVEPFQLQLICQFIEEGLVIGGGKRLIEAEDVSDLKNITHNYYRNVLEKFDADRRLLVATFIEDGLIFEEEMRRVSLLEGQIARQYGLSKEELYALVNAHLLRVELNTSGVPIYELSHDALISPILIAKQARKGEQEKRILLQKQEEERQRFLAMQAQRRKKIRNRLLAGSAIVGILLFSSFNIYQYRVNSKIGQMADSLKNKNQTLNTLTKIAESRRDSALLQKKLADTNALLAMSSAEKARLLAEEAEIQRKKAEAQKVEAMLQKNEALSQKKLAEKNAILAQDNANLADRNAKFAKEQAVLAKNNEDAATKALRDLQDEKNARSKVQQELDRVIKGFNEQTKLAADRFHALKQIESVSATELAEAERKYQEAKRKEIEALAEAKKIKATYLLRELDPLKAEQPLQAIRLAEAIYHLYPSQITGNKLRDLYGEMPQLALFSTSFLKDILTIKPIYGTEMFVIATKNGIIQLRTLEGKIVKEFMCEGGTLKYVDYCNATSLFLVVDNRGVHLYEKDGTLKKNFKEKESQKAVFSPDGERVLVINQEGVVRVLDTNGKEHFKVKKNKVSFKNVYFSGRGNHFATLADDNTAQLWDENGKMLSELKFQEKVTRIKPSQDGKYLLVISDNKYLKVWTWAGEVYASLTNDSNIHTIDYSPEESYIITGCQDGFLRIWQTPESPNSKHEPLIKYRYPFAVYSARFAPNFQTSRKLFIGANNTLYIQLINPDDILNWLKTAPIPPLDRALIEKYNL